jgi:hypothetical protein
MDLSEAFTILAIILSPNPIRTINKKKAVKSVMALNVLFFRLSGYPPSLYGLSLPDLAE